jgi:hypothetical protein
MGLEAGSQAEGVGAVAFILRGSLALAPQEEDPSVIPNCGV